MEHFSDNREFDLYRDINTRTNGEIYIGVVGPVRTGKSTFIKRFMDLMVLPFKFVTSSISLPVVPVA